MIELDFVAVSVIIGTLLPLVISLLKNVPRTWPRQVVKALALVVAVIAAVVQVGVDLGWTELSFSQVFASFGVIYALAQTTYKGIWEDTALEIGLALSFNKEAPLPPEDLSELA